MYISEIEPRKGNESTTKEVLVVSRSLQYKYLWSVGGKGRSSSFKSEFYTHIYLN